ncbi:MarR family winged helix-turn-helix transcriptional regulator [Pseudonocardia zijingensis]|uniref:MarR family transcriptional regulator n=1 Tax=Pseudonocardia zijingensis TaxID=153376 RepID=A0ABP4APS2_9PSEU
MSSEPQGTAAGALVWRLATRWRVSVDRALAPLDLTHAQYVLLAALHGLERAGRQPSQRELADETGLEALYVSKLARTLEAKGLVTRRRDTHDTRAVQLTLTDHGRTGVRAAMQTVQELLERLLEPLGGRHSARTTAFVRDLATLLDAPLA